ncbi:hypothetical protein HRU87_05420 [Aquiluna borgnonia]|uniref:Uncharacterized protein n=1 Tax=Aquiluna borgnonia TaxID=2499157 RepID=A0A7D4QGS2_9MICO|nr:hypothetical protein [Aquiluna borgnonia]QKJ25608.1 hypothetical protein HRU87_05420 [Aquiluna borgnonia]
MKRRSFAMIMAALIASASAMPSMAAAEDYLSGITLQGDEWLVMSSEQSRDGVHSMLALQPGGVGIGETRGDWISCTGIDDPTCSNPVAKKTILAWALLTDCTITDQEFCIESLKLSVGGQVLEEAKLIGSGDPRNNFEGNPKQNLLPGNSVPIYSTQTALNEAGNGNFAVMIRPSQFWDSAKGSFVTGDLEAAILPYFLNGEEGSGACLFTVGGVCARSTDFLAGTKIELTFRIPKSLGGWFSGRMKDPTISIAPLSAQANRIQITSEPVEVAALGLVKSKAAFTDVENMWQQNNGKWFANGGWATGANSWQPNIFPFIENYRPQVNDTAIGTNLVWKMRTIGSGGGSNCLADKSRVLGIVTTNALGYDIGSPEFRDGFLEYKVAGLHYMPNGKDLVIGTYDLIIESETARCLYGFTNAPVSATVTVVGTGDQNVASTVVSEKDGWLKLAAYGFTFSEKEIKVKLSQPLTKSLSEFSGSSKTLSAKQKNEVSALMKKVSSNPKFICTGTYVKPSDKAIALSRAKAVCNYAKGLDKNHSFFAQAKQTKAASYDGKVMVSSK